MFPNIDNNLGINAITEALNSRTTNFPSTDCIVEAVKICLQHNNSQFKDENFLQIHGTAMGPKNACSYADLAMGIIDQKEWSGNIKPNLWWKYRDDIFDLWTLGHDKLLQFTQFINSLYPTVKFTLFTPLLHSMFWISRLALLTVLFKLIYTPSLQITIYICYAIVPILSIAPKLSPMV